MADIDVAKESIGYSKVLLSIVIVTTISLIGWLLTNYETASSYKVIASIFSIIIFSITIILVDKNIRKKIRSLKDL